MVKKKQKKKENKKIYSKRIKIKHNHNNKISFILTRYIFLFFFISFYLIIFFLLSLMARNKSLNMKWIHRKLFQFPRVGSLDRHKERQSERANILRVQLTACTIFMANFFVCDSLSLLVFLFLLLTIYFTFF
jgi:hypothetical protein